MLGWEGGISADDANAGESQSEKWFGIGVRIAAFIILASIIGALLVFVIGQWNNPEIRAIVTAHLQATIGLPVAGVFAFLVVALFRTTEGRIRFEVLGLKFDGAAGPIIMWVFCFLAITVSIRLLWG
jgi:F0F1-type ATP synthase membrane subunit a